MSLFFKKSWGPWEGVGNFIIFIFYSSFNVLIEQKSRPLRKAAPKFPLAAARSITRDSGVKHKEKERGSVARQGLRMRCWASYYEFFAAFSPSGAVVASDRRRNEGIIT